MSLKQFENGDIFRNILETYPRFEIRLQGGFTYENNSQNISNAIGIGPPAEQIYEYKLDFSVKENSVNIPLI